MSGTHEPRSGRGVTLRDIAVEAEGSVETVSRVVNGETVADEALAVRVAELVKRLGYRPNELVRSLKGQRACTLGLVIAGVSNPFMATCAQAIEEVAQDHGHALILCDCHPHLGMESFYEPAYRRRRFGTPTCSSPSRCPPR